MLFPTEQDFSTFIARVGPRLSERFNTESEATGGAAAAAARVPSGADEFFVSPRLRELMERAVTAITPESIRNPFRFFQPFFDELKREGDPIRDDEAVFFVREVMHEFETEDHDFRLLIASALERMAYYFPNYAVSPKIHDRPLRALLQEALSGEVTWDGIEEQLVEKFGVDMYEVPDYVDFDHVALTAQFEALEAMEAQAHTDTIPAEHGKIGFEIQYGATRKEQVIAFLREFGQFPTTVQKSELDPKFVNKGYLVGCACAPNAAATYLTKYPALRAYSEGLDLQSVSESEVKLKRIPVVPEGMDVSQLPVINYPDQALTYLPLWLRKWTSAIEIDVRGNLFTKLDFPFHKLQNLTQILAFGDNVTEIKGLSTHQKMCVLLLNFFNSVPLRPEAVMGLINEFRQDHALLVFREILTRLKQQIIICLSDVQYEQLNALYQIAKPDERVMTLDVFKARFLELGSDS